MKHAGYGLGFERMIMYLTGMSNIRMLFHFHEQLVQQSLIELQLLEQGIIFLLYFALFFIEKDILALLSFLKFKRGRLSTGIILEVVVMI